MNTPRPADRTDAELRRLDQTLAAATKRRDDLAGPITAYREAERARAAARAAPEPQPAQTPGIGPLGWGAQETAPHRAWREAREQSDREYRVALGTLGADLPEDYQKRVDEAQQAVDRAERDVGQRETELGQAATKAAQAAPDIRTVNGIPMERGPDGIYRPVRVQSGAAAPEEATGTTAAAAKGDVPAGTAIEQTEKGPDGNNYVVRYKADGYGGKTLDRDFTPVRLEMGQQPGQVKTQQVGGQIYVSQDGGSSWQPATGLPTEPKERQTIQGPDGQLYLLSADKTSATPVSGIGGAVKTQQVGGSTFISKDNGATWEPAQGLPSVPSVQTVGGRAVGIDPLTGQQTFRTDLYSPEERARSEEAAGLTIEQQRRQLLPQDAVAAYTQEASRYQALAREERDRLLEQQRQGALTADQAGTQFQAWFAQQVEAPLAGLRSAAEQSRRREELEQAALQRQEDQRAELLNRQRETLGYQAGEQARAHLAQLVPHARSPEFLKQQGAIISAMSQRAGAPSAEAAAKVPAAAFTPAAFDPASARAVLPNFSAYARSATERALASISPAVAARIGAPLPQLPQGPDLAAMLSGVPYRGPLQAAPRGLQPLSGQEALDIGGGRARSYYSPTSFLDWDIGG